jgi:hypothetical protein
MGPAIGRATPPTVAPQGVPVAVPPQGPPAGADAPAPGLAQQVPAWAGNAEAAAVASKNASGLVIALSFILCAIGAGAAYALERWGNHAVPFQIGNQTSAYAGLVVFSAAVERFLEPIAQWIPGAKARSEYENAVAAMSNGHPAMTLRDVAAAKAHQDRSQANRTILMWGVATAVATTAAGASGFYLLHMIAAAGWTATIPNWVDALVTGLVVGTGTKPLHDLITRAQGSKDS